MTTTATRQKWFELLEKWEASGLGAAEFAASQDETVTKGVKTSPADSDKVKARLKEAVEIHDKWEAEAKEKKKED